MNSEYRREGAFLVPADFTPHTVHWAESKEPVYGNIIRLVRTALRLQKIDVWVDGMDNIPATGGAVIAINHTGYYDFILGGSPAWLKSRRLVRFMCKNDIFAVPVVGAAMRAMKHISVDRSAGAGALREAIAKVKDGQIVGIFPEATISRSFEIKEIKNGAVRIAAETNAPLIPVTVWGSQRIWTKDLPKNLLSAKVPVMVRAGRPVELSGDIDTDMETLRATMQANLEAVRAEYNERFGPFEPGLPWQPHSEGGSAPTVEEAKVLTQQERARREEARIEKRNRKLSRDGRIADAKANLAMSSSSLTQKLKMRLQILLEKRRGA